MRADSGRTWAIRVLMVMAGCLFSGGCGMAMKEKGSAPPPAPPAPSANVQHPPGTLTGFQLARSFAGPETMLEPVPSAMLLLTRDAPNNLKVCQEFLRMPTSEQLHSQFQIEPNIVRTRLLLNTQQPQADRLDDCRYLLSIYDYDRAQLWIKRLAIAGTKGPFFVVMFTTGGDGQSMPYFALDASTLTAPQLDGLVDSWEKTLGLASSTSKAVGLALSNQASAPGAAVCSSVGKTVQAVAPVLIAMAATALIAEYPAAGLFIGLFRSNDEGGSAITQIKGLVGKVSELLGQWSEQGCSWLFNSIRKMIADRSKNLQTSGP